jgi:O-antigen ligase
MTDLRSASLALIGLLLFGYVLGNRGFAHLGFPPVYVGELVLAISLFLFLLAPNFKVWTQSRVVWGILAFGAWCLIRTLPYIEDHGLDALRDSVIYGYSAFALLVAAAMARRDLLVRFLGAYGHAITFSVIVMPVLLFVTPTEQVGHDDLPVIFVKAGDAAVHLAGAAVFRLVGLHAALVPARAPWWRLVDGLFWTSWAAAMLWTASGSRGAMLAVAGAFAVTAAFGFARRRMAGLLAVLALVFTLFGLLSIGLDLGRRDVSVAQVIDNVSSILTVSGDTSRPDGDLESTIDWRLRWWEEILDYTIFGEYFWTGRGFGVSLADVDRFQADPEGRLRSPHSAHLTILARTGVPGLAIWLAFLAIFGHGIISAARSARRDGLPHWHRLHAWILAYWIAALINASFDVYLEGPQGGIWFWAITGLGIAALALGPRPGPDRP